jgi:DNA-binding transcriptional ArsR family regulator
MRSSTTRLVLWLLAGIAGVALLAWAFPRAFPFFPRPWSISRGEAVSLALERFRDLGPAVKDPYVVAVINRDFVAERRLQVIAGAGGRRQTGLRRWQPPLPVAGWQVIVYAPGARNFEWSYLAEISFSGEVLTARLRLDPQAKAPAISPEAARERAAALLTRQGVDLSRFDRPEIRSQQLAGRTDLTVRYRDRHGLALPGVTHGIQVFFAGDRLAGFGRWLDDPREKALARSITGLSFLNVGRILWIFLSAGVLAFPFLKRYHAGEIGVKRGVQIFFLVLAVGLATMLLSGRASAEDENFGFATREQNTWLVILFGLVFYVVPAALLSFFAWSVGESVCREAWGEKLTAFDALFQGKLANRSVARSAFRGWMAGLAVAGGVAALLLAIERLGGWPFASMLRLDSSAVPGLDVALEVLLALPFYLAVLLWVLPVAARRLGRWGGALLASLVAAVLLPAMALTAPVAWTFAVAFAFSAALVLLFLRTDLLTALLAGLVAQALFAVYPMLWAADPGLQLQGWLALAVLAVPLIASVRHLASGKDLAYRYEDIPPHVRRIAERERQRVELETARRIQSSILPDLPPRLAGVDIAHAYLPASEVGGDFYDVLALEDGRLAVAVGDVAGHGVSSGLIMSMAKSALAVQVTFDPEVAAVFNTLNRTVYQTARKRLLTTLCYALVDPRRLEIVYASAGHLHPYRIGATGRVESLQSIAYPLGVRGQLLIDPHTARLSPGDSLFLYSDGVVEARREGSDEMFGFERLEESLARHAGRGVEGLRDGVLEDVSRFTAHAPREDDQTILVLRLP